MRYDIITLFPELFDAFLRTGVTRRAYANKRVDVRLWPLRDFAQGQYRRVDDRPFGGGPGMVMMAQPLLACWQAVQASRQAEHAPPVPTLMFSPIGTTLNHGVVAQHAQGPGAVLICGRYEGVDQRFVEACVDGFLSLGDFVLSGGELPAMALLDAVARLQPGVLNDEGSHRFDSFNPAIGGLLDCPHYTRPEVWQGPKGEMSVPAVLLSGDHAKIAAYRLAQQQAVTQRHRPDLLDQ